MLDKILSAYFFFDFPSVPDHTLLIVYWKKTITDESLLLTEKEKIKLLGRIGINVLNFMKEIYDQNKFDNCPF